MDTHEILVLAERHIANEEYEEAERLCKQVVETDSGNSRAWVLLGTIAQRIGLPDVAQDLFRHAEALSPGTVKGRQVEAIRPSPSSPPAETNEELHGSNTAFIINRYLSTLAIQPANARARTSLARFLMHIGKSDEAIAHAIVGLDHGPEDPELACLAFDLTAGADRELPCEIAADAGNIRLPRDPRLFRLMDQAKSQLRASGGQTGIQRFAKYVAQLDPDTLDIACIGIFWRQCVARYGAAVPLEVRPLTYEHFAKVILSRSLAIPHKERFLKSLGYDTKSEREWNRLLFDDYIAPAIAAACEQGDYALVVYLDQANFYFGFAQQPYTEAQWEHCSSRIRPYLERAASQVAAKWSCPDTWPASSRPVVGFTTQWTFKGISADNLLMWTIEGIMSMKSRPFDPVLYVTEGNYEAPQVEAAKVRGIRVVAVADPGGDEDPFIRIMLALRERMRDDGACALVLMGVSESMATMAGALKLAPAQIFWTVGFRQVKLPSYWNGYFAPFSLLKDAETHNDRLWRQGPGYVPSPYPPEGSPEMMQVAKDAAELRQSRFGGRLILGAIGRPIKIQNPAYMDTLAAILRRNPGVAFLWTSPLAEAATAQRMIDERGISSQCVRMDWTSVAILGQLIDIHLDAFPFPNGHSMLETMYAGKAFVWLDNPTTRDGHCSCGVVMPVLEGRVGTADEQATLRAIFTGKTGENLAPAARSEEEYVAYAQRLIDDEDFRAAVGNAGRNFVTTYYSDKSESVRPFTEHCLEIIAEAKSRSEPDHGSDAMDHQDLASVTGETSEPHTAI